MNTTRPEQQRRLRRSQTDAERALWRRIRARQIDGHKFVRQFPVGRFVVDFCCRESRLVIELDGSQHTSPRDAGRTRFLESRDYRVLRFWDNDILTNPDGVLEVIRRAHGGEA